MLERKTRGLGIVLLLLAHSLPSSAGVVVTQAAPDRNDQLKLDLKLEDRSVEQVTVQSRAEGVAPTEQRVKASDGRSQIVVSKVEPTVVFPSGVRPKNAPKPLPAREQAFDSLLIEPTPAAGGQTLAAIHQWVLVVRAQRTPLRWDPERLAYTTELIVGLQGAGASRGASADLSQPMEVHLTTDGAKVDPPHLKIEAGGVAGFRTAVILLASHETKATVTALTDLGEQAYQVMAEPSLGALRLELGDDDIAGFGVGTTRLSAVRLAEDGREWFAPKALDVRIATRGRGNLATELLHFEKNQARSGSVELRSAFLGESAVVAEATGVAAQRAVIRFTMPWTLVVAIALGATLGAGIRWLTVPADARQPRELAVNFLSGILISIASLLGVAILVDLPQTARLTEAGCLVIAAVAAYLGSGMLQRLGAKLGSPSQ